MEQPIIALQNGGVRDESRRFRTPVNFTLEAGEHIAVMGLNGSGKTILIETLLGNLYLAEGKLNYDFRSDDNRASQHIRYITFRDAYGSADGEYYYQQRWNATDRESAPLASEMFDRVTCDPLERERIFDLLGIRGMLQKQIILLSSGELRKFQIAKMLLAAPRVLVVESPFIGLDVEARRTLEELFVTLTRRSDVQIVLSVSSPADIPSFVTHVCTVDGMRCGAKQTRETFLRDEPFSRRRAEMTAAYERQPIQLPPPLAEPLHCDEVVRLRNVTIRYGERTVLDSVNWTIRGGDKWTLTGANGSGKSTLLSLICADNPQSYAQDIVLFGRQRGSGESIWDIKKHIGYVSPEMHRSYIKNIPAIDIVASGFFDSIGLYLTPNDDQRAVCEEWLKTFEMGGLRDKSFVKLSSGEQRLLLLARAFVKDPDLLILDEPLHGLDCYNKERARAVIEAFCRRPDKTMIYVTHYERELPRCVDKKMVLQKHA